MNASPYILAAVMLAVAMLAGGCDENNANPASNGSGSAAAALPAGLFLDAEPEHVRGIVEARRAATEGERVAIRGRIGGSVQPFVPGRAVMTIVDPALPTCGEGDDACCETPWDYCCEPRAEVVAHAATIQISDDAGVPLRAGLNGAGGLEPLTEVVVVGAVGRAGSQDAFVIHAEGIYIVRR